MSPNDGWEPYRKAHAYLVPAADDRCDNCGRTHVQTWFYGRGDDDSWWGYCTWFVRAVGDYCKARPERTYFLHDSDYDDSPGSPGAASGIRYP